MPYHDAVPHRYLSQRLELQYYAWGSPAAPVLLLVHGERDHGRSWYRIAKRFSDEWYVVAPDLRGHGDSSWSPDGNYPFHAYVNDIAELVRQLDVPSLSIVGHSMGGSVVVRYAGAGMTLIDRLIVIEGLGYTPAVAQQRDAIPAAEKLGRYIDAHRLAAERQPRSYASVADAAARLLAAQPFLGEQLALELSGHGVRQDEAGAFVWKYDACVRIPAPCDFAYRQMTEMWRRIEAPVLFVQGNRSDDPWADDPALDGRLSYFPNARSTTVNDAGHWVQHDQPEMFSALVRGFLSGSQL